MRKLVTIVSLFTVFFAFSVAPADALSGPEMKKASKIYFNMCAGCHGTLRKGATGPNLTPKNTVDLGLEALEEFINSGTEGGMPNWGEMGLLSKSEITLVSKFLMEKPVAPPEISLKDMRKTWKVLIPENARPKKPQTDRHWRNFFGVVERDAGKVVIIDGDTKEIVARLDGGFAIHILRTSASGRYIFSVGRDGRVSMIDLWMKTPTVVAEVKPCSEARSVDTSKFHGYEDKLAIVGCYWPPHAVILDGATLEPKKVVSTRGYTVTKPKYHPEPRVAAIVASHYTPEWVCNIKETGMVWLIDYTDIVNLNITMIEAERFLHDGGWDSTHRYFMPAANMVDKMVVIDTKLRKKVATIDVGTKPHPGRGANFVDPKYGPVHSTVHIGEGLIAVWGTDPKNHPKHAWKVVRNIELPAGSGSLFIKTHPKSKNLWVDFTLNTNLKAHQSVGVLDINNLEKGVTMIQITEDPKARVTHMEYNKDGDEVWVSVWAQKGEIVIFDDKTRKIKKRIKGLRTPTGKFNVHNTQFDIY